MTSCACWEFAPPWPPSIVNLAPRPPPPPPPPPPAPSSYAYVGEDVQTENGKVSLNVYLLALNVFAFKNVILYSIEFQTDNIASSNINHYYYYFSTMSFFGHDGSEMVSGCNSDCQCTQEVYNPVCGIDGILYYSPCYAGCQTENGGEEKVCEIVYAHGCRLCSDWF